MEDVTIRPECLKPASIGWEQPTGQEVRAVVKRAGFTGRAAARFLGLGLKGDRTVRRWIGNDSRIPYAAWALLCHKAGLGQIWDEDAVAVVESQPAIAGQTTESPSEQVPDAPLPQVQAPQAAATDTIEPQRPHEEPQKLADAPDHSPGGENVENGLHRREANVSGSNTAAPVATEEPG